MTTISHNNLINKVLTGKEFKQHFSNTSFYKITNEKELKEYYKVLDEINLNPAILSQV